MSSAMRIVLAVVLFLLFALVQLLQTKTSFSFASVFNRPRLKDELIQFDDEDIRRGTGPKPADIWDSDGDEIEMNDDEEGISENAEKDDDYIEPDTPKKEKRRPRSNFTVDPKIKELQELAKRSNGTKNDVLTWDDSKIPNYYNDEYDVYNCQARFSEVGTRPRFMVIGVHKGGSTALYDYLVKHGRVRPAVCKEMHYFDDNYRYHKGKDWYLRHFPDVTMWKDRIITGEGTPNYIRLPIVPGRVKAMFPGSKFLLTLREPAMRFQSHWVGRVDNKQGTFVSMSCVEAWNASVAAIERCRKRGSQAGCEYRLYENAAVRGIYHSQIKRWLAHFPAKQIHIIQAEQMFKDPVSVLQRATEFLKIRPYTQEELDMLHLAKKGSAHHELPLLEECSPVREQMRQFYEEPNRILKQLFQEHFPYVLENWVDGWSGI